MSLTSLPPDHPLAGARAKIDRAGENLKTLKAEIRSFGEGGGHAIREHRDPGSGDYLVRISPAEPPLRLATIVGNVVGDLRAALDYLVYALAELDSGKPQTGTQFPIVDSPDDFARLRPRYLKGVSGPHVAMIEGAQPYDTGQWLARLRDLSNPDKHRHLITVASSAQGTLNVLSDSTEPETEWGPTRPDHYDDMGVYLSIFFHVAFEDGTRVTAVLGRLHRQVSLFVYLFKGEFEPPRHLHAV